MKIKKRYKKLRYRNLCCLNYHIDKRKVCNKLLKQAFAVAKSRLPYNKNYRSTLMKN